MTRQGKDQLLLPRIGSFDCKEQTNALRGAISYAAFASSNAGSIDSFIVAASPSLKRSAYAYANSVSTGVLLGVCSLSVVIRFYIRLWAQRQFSVDDGLLAMAVCCLICSVVIMYSVALDKMYQIQQLSAALPFALSIGFPIDDMPLDSQFLQDSYDFLKWITVSQALAWTSVMAVKFSFLFLFRKLIDRMPPLITYWWLVLTFNIIALGYGLSTYFLYCPYFNDPKLCTAPPWIL
ncbi:MAG: hypothetical protein LQ350_005701 [Teloschistes chrysophthalmus]|nr:MAG: hypothetical protein LQ350_005701 [Niorma chrysophthalma]